MTKRRSVTKTKEVDSRREQRTVKQQPKPREEGANPEILARREFWQTQIDNLMGRSFESLDQAIDVIVTEVLNTIAPGEKHSDEEREMLHTMLATDPEFAEDLEMALDIRKR